MAPSSFIFNVDTESFQAQVVDASHQKPVIVDFWAPWCGPCRALTPILEKAVTARNGDVLLAKVNTDENPELASYFQIEGIPAVKAIHKGQLVLQFEGVLPPEQIEEFLNRLSPDPKEKAAQSHAAKLEQADPTNAEAEYLKLLETAPDNTDARLGLARIRLNAGRFDEIESVLEPIPPGGEPGAEADRIRARRDLRKFASTALEEGTLRARIAANNEDTEAHFQLGCTLAVHDRFEESLRAFLSAAEIDRDLARTKVKEWMVKVFHIIGVRSDLADESRAKLQRLLY
jgi:putative thioredoxin